MDSKKRSVFLPEGKWRYFFADRELLEGGVVVDREYPMDEFPVFVKEGAIVPLRVKRAYTGFGDTNSEGFITILVYPKDKNSFVYYHTDGVGETNISYQMTNDGCKLSLLGTKIPHMLRVHSKISPKEIYLDGEILERDKFWDYDDLNQKIIIKNSAEYSEGRYTVKF